MKIFLTAEWKHLINLTYQVPPDKLTPYLPQGLELDLLDGQAHVSLVAFDFQNTRVKGIKVPFHVNFPEVNLRFYVRYMGHRGVVFIREYVPKHCIAFIAQRFYNEPYVSFPMESKHEMEADGQTSQFKIWKNKDEFSLKVRVGAESEVPGEETLTHFFKEHDLGFGRDKKGIPLAYKVAHPVWAVRQIQELDMNFDFEKLYGDEWAFLNDAAPVHQMFADGSAVKVFAASEPEKLLNVASNSGEVEAAE